jgi:hypothetical protein
MGFAEIGGQRFFGKAGRGGVWANSGISAIDSGAVQERRSVFPFIVIPAKAGTQ